jgi:hypothetical protein
MTKLEFKDLTNSLFLLLNQPAPEVDMLRDWWNKLESYGLEKITKAYDSIIDLQINPTIENILFRLNPPKHQHDYPLRQPNDGRNWAREIMNGKKGNCAYAVKEAKIALNIN